MSSEPGSPEKVKVNSIIDRLREQGLATKQTNITSFTITKRLNEFKRDPSCCSSLQQALQYYQIHGKYPMYKINNHTKEKTLEEVLSGLQHVTPDAKMLVADDNNKEVISQQGIGISPYWDAHLNIKKRTWRAMGGTPILGDTQTSYFRSEYQMPYCSVQKFDHFGSFLASGYSYGEIMLHDIDDFESVVGGAASHYHFSNNRKVQDNFTDCNFNIVEYPMEGNDALRIQNDNSENIFAFHSPLIRFTPRTRKPIQSVLWVGEESTHLNVTSRLSNSIELFDLERCPETLDDNGRESFADPIQRFLPRTDESGANASTPTDICSDNTQENTIWSGARDGKIRMWDKRERNCSPTLEKSISSSEITSIETQGHLLWITSRIGAVHVIDTRNISGSRVSFNTTADKSIFCTYSPTKLLQAQSINDISISANTRHLCALKIIDGQFITTMSGDGTIVMFDPNISSGSSEFNNAKLLSFYQSSKLYTDKLLNTNMFDILPTTSRSGHSLLIVPSENKTFSILDMFGKNVERSVVNNGYPVTCLASHPSGSFISSGYGNQNSNFGSLVFG